MITMALRSIHVSLVCAIAACVCLTGPGVFTVHVISTAAAQTAIVPPQAGLDAKLASLKAALAEKKYGALVEDFPPRLLNSIASKVNLPADKFKQIIVEQIDKIMASASIESFEVQPADIQKLANGTPYALMPSIVRMTISDKKAVSTGHIVAIVDGGSWYLARISEQQWPIFVETYPEYAELKIPQEKLEFVK